MIPPHVRTSISKDGARFKEGVICLEGSLLGILFEDNPPRVYAVDTGDEVPTTWSEEVTGSWHAEAPNIGGDIQTRVEIKLASYTPGQQYRLIYPSSLHGTSEAILTAE